MIGSNVEGDAAVRQTLYGAAAVLGWTAVALMITSLWQASIGGQAQVGQLGRRPIGGRTGSAFQIWQRCWSQWMYHRVGMTWGYDPALGALSPSLHIMMHLVGFLFVWSMVCCLIATTSTFAPSARLSFCGCIALVLYSALMFLVHHILPGVSIPSGPRPHKIQRQPIWARNQQHVMPDAAASAWRFVTARESHQVTRALLSSHQDFDDDGDSEDTGSATKNKIKQQHGGIGEVLTGEPAGRDIWTHFPAATPALTSSDVSPALTPSHVSSKTSSSPSRLQSFFSSSWATASKQAAAFPVDETLVQTMAAGGRDYGVFDPSVNPNSCDMPFRAQQIRAYLASGKTPPDVQHQPQSVRDALHKGVHFYSMLQCDDGHWSGDYGGPHFLMPGLIVAWYVMGQPAAMMLDSATLNLIQHYFLVHQQVDGGWGTHIESPSTMFGTTLIYVALRLMGMSPDDLVCVKARDFIRAQGGATMTSSWAKLYLCLLGCMDWNGHISVPPEMWLLPNWFPFHPGRMWCHARMVYLPMGYLYGARFVYPNADSDPVIKALRKELYLADDYHSIPWIQTQQHVADMDNYSPVPWIMKTAMRILARYETWSWLQFIKNGLRQRGLAFAAEYMAAEDLQTNYIDIGPVNKVLNMVCAYHHHGFNAHNPILMKHYARIADYLWLAEDGMKFKGYNGSQCWDTSFAIQAIYEADLMEEFPETSRKVWSYLERCQILSTEVSQATAAYEYEAPDRRARYYRHLSQGGWPFSTSAHGWPISDCTGEGLKGVLCLAKSPTVQQGIQEGTLRLISTDRLYNAVSVLLTYQNEDGGFATYENTRGWGWYESLNPSEVFGEIMIDYGYVECSMAALTALVAFHKDYPNHRAREIQFAIKEGHRFLKSLQREDGSWYGNWACCFCYAGWFGIEGLIACGEPLDSLCIAKACEFLIRHQRCNGGWGEDFTSCYDKAYSENGMHAYGDEGSGIVNTGWALLALAAAHYPDVRVIRRGVQYLMKRQLPSGDWPQEGIAGVFNRACGITYTSYRNVFPIWALGRCRAVYGDVLDQKDD